jgi:hypothetical protein
MAEDDRPDSPSALDLDIDEDRPVGEQLREALMCQGANVVALFKDWDDDDSGSVSQGEFRRAMRQLGFDAERDVVDMLFNEWATNEIDQGLSNADGTPELSMDELAKALGAVDKDGNPTPARPISKKNKFAKAKPLPREAMSMQFDIDESEGARPSICSALLCSRAAAPAPPHVPRRLGDARRPS